ncbi:MAG: PHP domain-containing protein [Candidatus Omnitrophica bacterium]|nr:PHP domain-containing protein [Candidatus Omnitrophota bacterium]
MTKFADLHIHTCFSDSSSSPQDVVRQAVAQGLSCIAITDHDTVDGVMPTVQAAQDYDLEIVSGVELSCEVDNKDIHILGYFVDCQNENFAKKLKRFQQIRIERIHKIIENLQVHGIDNITFEEVFRRTEADAVGRAHLAFVLVQKGWASNNSEAFDKYLGEHCSTYVPKYKQTPQEAITLIKAAGGAAVLAHPMVTNRDELIPSLVEAGLDGVEVYYHNCSAAIYRYYEKIASKHGLAMTGGSDSHGDVKKYTYIGKQKISCDLVEELRERAGARI